MDINTKLQEFKQSVEEMASREYKQIEKNVDEEIKSGIEEELAEYETKKQANYDKNIQKIEKDYNKKVFNYEIQCKKEIIDEEKKMKLQIKNEAADKLKEFTKSDKYQEFLDKCINERYFKN